MFIAITKICLSVIAYEFSCSKCNFSYAVINNQERASVSEHLPVSHLFAIDM